MKDKFVITSRDINKLPDGKHRIERGLYLKVRYDGKQRQYLFRFAGREKVIGSAFDISFNDAKRIAAKLRLDIAEGNVNEAMAPREAVEHEREPTFAEIAKAAIRLRRMPSRSWGTRKSQRLLEPISLKLSDQSGKRSLTRPLESRVDSSGYLSTLLLLGFMTNQTRLDGKGI